MIKFLGKILLWLLGITFLFRGIFDNEHFSLANIFSIGLGLILTPFTYKIISDHFKLKSSLPRILATVVLVFFASKLTPADEPVIITPNVNSSEIVKEVSIESTKNSITPPEQPSSIPTSLEIPAPDIKQNVVEETPIVPPEPANYLKESDTELFDVEDNYDESETEENIGYSCNCSKTCTAMASCDEAYYQLNSCGCSARDGDDDGVPCESLCR